MLELTGKSAIITGCSSGIGEEIARLFSKQGANVTIVARREERLQTLAEELRKNGTKVLVVAGDVTKIGFPEEVCEKTMKEFGKIDILVNNAGIGDKNVATVRTSDELWNTCLEVNQNAPFRFCRAAVKYMKETGTGAIVNMSSIGGVYSIAGAAYSSAKAALLGMTKNIAIQFAGSGIRCNAVCPGATDTPMLAPTEGMDEEMLEASGNRCDLEVGLCQPSDIANAVLFFVSDEARYINGQFVVVDRGSCI